MKKNSYTFGSIIILVIVIFAFIILTPTGLLSGGKESNRLPEFGNYSGKSIRYEQGSTMANAVTTYAQMYQYYNGGRELDQQAYYSIFYQAFQRAVLNAAAEDELKKTGYTVPVSAINREMMQYFTENGVYSSKLYKQADEEKKLELRNDIEASLLENRFDNDVYGSSDEVLGKTALYGLKESDAEMDFLSAFNSEKRGFSMAAFATNSYPEDLKLNFAKENASKFVKYDLSAITVEDKSTAKSVAKRLANSEISFEDAVTEYGQRTYVNAEGNLIYKYQYQIENILSNADDMAKLSALAMGDVSDIIQTGSGFTLFMANTTAKEADFTDADTIKQVSTYISIYEKDMTETYFKDRAKEFKAAAEKDFAKACKDFGVEEKTIEPFPLNYGNTTIADKFTSDENALYNANTNEDFLKAAFSLKKDEVSDPIVMNNNVVVLQYNKTETADADAAAPNFNNFDRTAVATHFITSKKLKNNFAEAYSKLN